MKNENVRKRKLTREKQRLLLWEKNMGFLSRLFGGNQSNAVEQVRSQPEGFYIVKYEYGEGQARSLFQKAEAGDVDAKRKMGEIQEEINQSDKLMDELASLILSDSNN